MEAPLTEKQKFPLLTEKGRSLLKWFHEHPHAPTFNHRCGDRLGDAGLQRVKRYEAQLKDSAKQAGTGALPPWVRAFARSCLKEVPFFRRRGGSAERFEELPPVTRADLGREPWAFVPDSQSLDDLIVYNTSGVTGHPLAILCHPEVSSQYIPLLRLALRRHGVALKGGAGRVSIILACYQERTYTYASVSSYLGQAGFAKINLNSKDWRDPGDRARFLDSCNPEIYTGDPISFQELARLKLRTRPKALVATAMTLLPSFQKKLEKHFKCPVVDLYSMNETGPIAVATTHGHEIVAGDIHVEILGSDGKACPLGVRGEIVVTCARNPFLPLLRYRTGDWAALEFHRGAAVLKGLEGRPPVLFRSASGGPVNNIDVSNALRLMPISQFSLHQEGDGQLVFRMRDGGISHDRVRSALERVFGGGRVIRFEVIGEADTRNGKTVQYTSDVA